MAVRTGNALDLTQYELLNAVLQNLAAAPGSPKPGQFWFNTGSGRIEYRNNSAVVTPHDRATHFGSQLASTITDFDTQVRTSRLDQMSAPTASVNLNGQKITNQANGTAATDSCAYGQLTGWRLDQLVAPTGPVSLNSQKITSLALATAATDGASLQNITNAVSALRLNNIAVDANVSLGSYLISSSGTPAANNDLTNKLYVDTQITQARTQQDWKDSVRTATSGNVALTGLQTINGVTLVAGDRVLVRANTAGAENGIWVAATGAWTRAADATQGNLTSGAQVTVEEGTLAGSQYRLSTANPITVGTTALSWVLWGASQVYTADGTTLQLSGNTFSAITGVNNGLSRRYAALIGDGTATSFVINHGWNTTDVCVDVYEVSTGDSVLVDRRRSSANAVTVTFGAAPAASSYRVVIVG